jgi:hypothetical protein
VFCLGAAIFLAAPGRGWSQLLGAGWGWGAPVPSGKACFGGRRGNGPAAGVLIGLVLGVGSWDLRALFICSALCALRSRMACANKMPPCVMRLARRQKNAGRQILQTPPPPPPVHRLRTCAIYLGETQMRRCAVQALQAAIPEDTCRQIMAYHVKCVSRGQAQQETAARDHQAPSRGADCMARGTG